MDNNIVGEDGDDTLTGGPGVDVFVCGGGQDTVRYYNEEEGDIEHLVVGMYRE